MAEITRLFLEYRLEYLQETLENLGWLNAEQKRRLDRVRKHQENAGQVLSELRKKTGEEQTRIQELALSERLLPGTFLGTSYLQEIWVCLR